MTRNETVYAAGGVVWRVTGGKLRVLVVHRDEHRDISFPKGKVKAGEILAETAAREVREETGIGVPLGPPLGVSRYTLPSGRMKVVHYWSMRAKDSAVRESAFSPNHEISAIEWLSPHKALKRLTYDFDVTILENFLARFDSGVRATFPVVALRHAAATPRSDWNRADHLRPLLPRGKHQARALAGELAAFGVRKIVSSTATRCIQTVKPFAKAADRPIAKTDALSQDAWEDGLDDVRGVVAERIAAGKPAVLCSHGPVLPAVLEEIARATGGSGLSSWMDDTALATGSFHVAHVNKRDPAAGIVATETHAPLI